MSKRKIDLKKPYTYYFADGTKSTVSIENVGEKWLAIINQMNEDERRANYNYNRWNTPMSAFEFESDQLADPNGDAFDELMRRADKEKFEAAMETLTEKQRELVHKRFYEMMKVKDIAEQEGVDPTAITHRLERIQKKLEKFLS